MAKKKSSLIQSLGGTSARPTKMSWDQSSPIAKPPKAPKAPLPDMDAEMPAKPKLPKKPSY